jgi:bifunctional non-homologous end joining protein LigD
VGRVRAKPKLSEYRAKRRFDRTAEPRPKVSRSRTGRHYVIQKHDATRLHYDFRLEHDGALKSWAIPKGPSLDPSERVLAVQVEDHPVDYGSFEGVIPEGEYGGGTVLLWDRGTWEPMGDAAEGLRTGKLKFKLNGKKLRGGWMLVRMHGREGDEDGKNWLLIKERDQEAVPRARGDVREDAPLSVASGRDLPDIAEARDRVWSSGRKRAGRRSESSLPRGPGRGVRATSTAASRSRDAETKAALRRLAGAVRKSGARAVVDPGSLPGARKTAMPEEPLAQLATLVDEAPEGDTWLHEVKFDGYRILCRIHRGRVQLLTRRGNDWTPRFRAVGESALKLHVQSAILDGEVVVLTPEGKSDFQSLQNSLKGLAPKARLLYFVFDLLYLDGYDLTGVPLLQRKGILERLLAGLGGASVLRYSAHIQGHGRAVFQQACTNRLEGIVAKRADSLYSPKRTRDWLKIKCGNRQEFVIGGYTEPSGKREVFGALLLGYYDKDGHLAFAGRVGTGFNEKMLKSMLKGMHKHETDRPPFKNPPTGPEARGVRWLKPVLVGEVQFSEWTRDGTLRHPSFQGLREDKDPKDVIREEPKVGPGDKPELTKPPTGSRTRKAIAGAPAVRRAQSQAPADGAARVAGVTLSNPARVMYPENGITKLDLARYYEEIAEWVLPHMVGRPLTLVRCPQGRQGTCFYQKHLTERMPASVHGVTIKEKDGKDEEYLAVENLTGLVGLVQMGVLELHTWGCLEDDVEKPDRLIIDLDPGPGVTWERVIGAARLVRERLEDAGLESFVKTTGGKGLHVVIPLQPRVGWDEAKAFTKIIADGIVRDQPDEYTAIMTKSRRTNKIFIDYLRNGRGATAIAPYSTRAREGAPVATPLTWEELSPKVKPTDFTAATIPKRLAKLRRDPWEGISAARQAITPSMSKGR